MALARVRDYFGPYRLTRLIRSGHSSEVWEAAKETEATRYALKIIKPEQRKNAAEIAALKHEVEVGKQLRHPNVIGIYEYAVEQDTPYLVMELYSALNLKLVLRKGIQQVGYLVPKFISQAAEALYHMHDKGFIHCDVKPDNFLVSPTGDVKLIDFAISRSLKQSMLAGLNPLTWFNKNIQGTRSYMSPEQIRGQRLDVRADIYSFGCVLFELVGGKTPYSGNSADDLLRNHISAPIPAAQAMNNNVTPEFSNLIQRMMAKRPADRPPSMWEFLKDFRGVRVFKQVPKPPAELNLRLEDFEDKSTLLRKPKKGEGEA